MSKGYENLSVVIVMCTMHVISTTIMCAMSTWHGASVYMSCRNSPQIPMS